MQTATMRFHCTGKVVIQGACCCGEAASLDPATTAKRNDARRDFRGPWLVRSIHWHQHGCDGVETLPDISIAVVPEPSCLALLFAGLFGVGFTHRKRTKNWLTK